MSTRPVEVSLEVNPCARLDVIDVRGELQADHVDALAPFPRALYCSFHTTAGYLEQGLAARLQQSGRAGEPAVEPFVKSSGRCSRKAPATSTTSCTCERLSDEQRADRAAERRLAPGVHGAGLRTCVTYVNRPNEPVYFVDLDGVNGGHRRQRPTSIVGFTSEEEVARERLVVPVSAHPVDSVNLKDPRLGLYEQLEALGRALRRRQGPHPIDAGDGRAAGRAHGQRVRDAADAPRPRRRPARAAALHGREGAQHPRAPARDPEQDARLREVRHGARVQSALRRVPA